MVDRWGDMTELRALGEGLADAKKARVATFNRVERGGTKFDSAVGDRMKKLAQEHEDRYKEYLLEVYGYAVPDHVRKWAADIPGLGSGLLFPRIISVIGNPRVAIPMTRAKAGGKLVLVPDGEPYARTPRQLWQYCGCGDPMTNPRSDILGHSPTQEDKLRGGKRTTARPLLRTFSDITVRMHGRSEAIASGKYYQEFVAARTEAEAKVHTRQCQNKKRPPFAPDGCGTVQHPEWGAPGSPWRAGHMNAHAHRMMQKEFLLDLWVACGEQ